MRTNDTVVLKFKEWILHGNNTVSPAPSRFEIYHRSGTYCVIGPDATIYGIFSDEMAFQADAEDAYTGALPTIKGGGRFTGVSSANPGFFHYLCENK